MQTEVDVRQIMDEAKRLGLNITPDELPRSHKTVRGIPVWPKGEIYHFLAAERDRRQAAEAKR